MLSLEGFPIYRTALRCQTAAPGVCCLDVPSRATAVVPRLRGNWVTVCCGHRICVAGGTLAEPPFVMKISCLLVDLVLQSRWYLLGLLALFRFLLLPSFDALSSFLDFLWGWFSNLVGIW